MAKVLAHIVLYQSSSIVLRTIESLLSSPEVSVVVTSNDDNAKLLEQIEHTWQDRILLRRNVSNLGFAAAQNQALELVDGHEFVLFVNPDVSLLPDCLEKLLAAAQRHPDAGFFTPLLLRADDELRALEPAVIDAAGMQLFDNLRHLDRDSGKAFLDQYKIEKIFGGTGALLLVRVAVLKRLLLPRTKYDQALWNLYPQLLEGAARRPQLFDEAFFAYREDADLAWRAKNEEIACLFIPEARALHVRRVVPELRSELPAHLNLFGVRNRFLLQFNNLSLQDGWRRWLCGALVRNLIVIVAVILRERSSLIALTQAWKLLPRALEQRRLRRL